MAYFPNGSSGDYYLAEQCLQCINWRDLKDGRGYGCPIWDAHQDANYDQCKDKKIKALLEILWPTKDDGFPGKCSMFQSNGDCKGQMIIEQALKRKKI